MISFAITAKLICVFAVSPMQIVGFPMLFSIIIFSNAREAGQLVQGLFQKKPLKDLVKDMREDQRANKWGRSGGDPNRFRPKGLDRKYKK